jgi:hypothetical protein
MACGSFFIDQRRTFTICNDCELVFVPESGHCSIEDEKKRYALHDNRVDNNGYVRFLDEIVDVVGSIHYPGQRILDFGCGKHAVLGELLHRKGYECDSYDPLYGIGMACHSKRYDVVVLCEVVEHLRRLNDETVIIKNMLDPQGKVVVRTNQYPSREEFGAWWYKEDPTHINFFSRESLIVFGRTIGCQKIEFIRQNITVFHKDL